MKLKARTWKKPRIEMLPLIDVVFLLLVVFLYAMLSMAVHRGLPVSLPSSRAAEPEQAMTLSVTVRQQQGRDMALFVNREPVALADLGRVLREGRAGMEKSGQGGPGVLLFADKHISYQQIFVVLDSIRSAGIADVSLQAETEGLR